MLRKRPCIRNCDCLAKAKRLIEDFECDLYENAIVPIALAHKYTAISLEPGAKVLDLLSQTGIKSATSGGDPVYVRLFKEQSIYVIQHDNLLVYTY